MRLDMSASAIEARLMRAAPPDLRPENRMRYKLDMSSAAIECRLDQVGQMNELCDWLRSGTVLSSAT